MSLATLFDYGTLDTETRVVVQQKTTEIKDRVRRSRQDILEIGERLIDIKERLGHGSFGRWLEVEFGWTDRTAQGFMSVADAFKSDIISDLDITPTALRSLAAPSVPEPARQEAIESARNGNHIGTKEAAKIIETHKPDRADAHTAKAPAVEQDESDPESRAEEESQETEQEEEVDETPDPEAVPVNGRRTEVEAEAAQENEEPEEEEADPPDGSVTTYKCPVCPKEYYAPVWHCLSCQTHNPSDLMACKDCRTLRGDQPPPVAMMSPQVSAEKETQKDEILKAMAALSGRINGLRPYTHSIYSQYPAHKRKRSVPTVKRLHQLTGELLVFLQGGEA